MVFTKVIHVRGNLISSYVFEGAKEMHEWHDVNSGILQKEHGKLDFHMGDIEPLKVGDTCKVSGEGAELFVIEKLIKYSPHRYGFILDSGWSEEVHKCYK